MTPSVRVHGGYSHALLVHRTDDELVDGTRSFVEQGLASGARVLVHGPADQVDLLRMALDADTRLEFGFEEELYQSPGRTLFEYQRKLAESPADTELWVTGTVPLGHDELECAAWARYESAVNEALCEFPFKALCTYDARTRPAWVLDAARATHPVVSSDVTSCSSPEYVDPAAFLESPLARVPRAPTRAPSLIVAVDDLDQVARARALVRSAAARLTAVPRASIEEFVIAVSEVTANGVVHGAPPVGLTLWTDLAGLTCQIVDSGPGNLDPLTGLRYPDETSPLGLWATRQLVDDLLIGRGPRGGCSVLMTKS